MKSEPFSIRKRMQSFKYAFNGFKILLIEEHNARIHMLVAVLVIIAGVYFNVSVKEWVAIVFAIVLVFAAELFNSSIENLADFVTKEPHPEIKKVKDLSAAAVLICAVGAVVIGLLVFIPRIFL